METSVLIARLRRFGNWLDKAAWNPAGRARVNLVRAAADRLEQLDAPRAGYERFSKQGHIAVVVTLVCQRCGKHQPVSLVDDMRDWYFSTDTGWLCGPCDLLKQSEEATSDPARLKPSEKGKAIGSATE